MIQIRIHGRGGQGVVTAAELIAIASFIDGKQSQAFPFFGVERTGAPVESYVRIDDKPIKTHEQIYQPDILIIQDSTLLNNTNIFNGVGPKTKIIINTSQNIDSRDLVSLKETKSLRALPPKNIYTIDATKIAMEILGKNIVNTVILGALIKFTDIVSLDSLISAIKEKFAGKDEKLITKNIEAIKKAFRC